MIPFTRFWRWWTDTWRAPSRARLLYGVMAIAFAVLTLFAAMQADALVIVFAATGTLVSIVLSVIAPRLSKAADSPLGKRGDR